MVHEQHIHGFKKVVGRNRVPFYYCAPAPRAMCYHDCLQWLENHSLSCPMKQLTGMDCPGCGMQRAVVALLRGDLGESLMLHPAAIPTLFIFIYLALHLRFKFAHGAAVLKWTFILIATITTLNYIFKIIHYGKS